VTRALKGTGKQILIRGSGTAAGQQQNIEFIAKNMALT
jgi:hypothetical protein